MIHFSAEVISRLEAVGSKLKEVETRSFEESLALLKTKSNPDQTLSLWESIAEAYRQTMSENEGFDINQKKEVYEIILRLTAAMPDFSAIKYVSLKQIQRIEEIFSKTVHIQLQNFI